jgi:hypothetical protein
MVGGAFKGQQRGMVVLGRLAEDGFRLLLR